MPNQYVNKVVINDTTKLDLTSDTVTAADLRNGVTAHNMSGAPITGTLAVPNNQASKAYSVLSGGSFSITPDSGYDGMEAVALTVPSTQLEFEVSVSKLSHIADVYIDVLPIHGRPNDGFIKESELPATEHVQVTVDDLTDGTYTLTDTQTKDIKNYKYVAVDEPDLVASNILNGKSILGVNGSYTVPTETKTATANGTVTPTSGKYLSSVTVAIPTYDGSVT